MEPRVDLTPKLSVVVPAPGGVETVRGVLDRWDAQPRREELELVLLAPGTGAAVGPPGLRVVDCSGLLLHEARARGIREASADHVLLAEDHCVPDEGWGEAILGRLPEGWDGVAGCLVPGGLSSAWSQAAFLLGYGEWMPPLVAGEAPVLPGHNVVLRRRLLLDLGAELEELLLVSAFLVRRLSRTGRFALDDRATMRHFDATALRPQLAVFRTVGRSFGAIRTSRWPTVARALYPLGLPVVAAAHWRRALVHYRRAGRQNGLGPACLAAAAVLACAWAWGEAAGALLGPSRVARGAWASEVKPVSRSRLERENA